MNTFMLSRARHSISTLCHGRVKLRRRGFLSVLLALVAVALSGLAAANESKSNALPTPETYVVERAQFVLARKAIKAGQTEVARQLASTLTHYPLYRYLVYEQLRREFLDKPDKKSVARLNQFEKDFDDEALTRKLTQALQRGLIDNENWSLFLGVSKSRVAANMACAKTRALHETGRLKKFDDTTRALWVNTAKRPKQCAKALAALESRSQPGIVALWDRIFTAMEKNRPAIAKELSAQLASGDRQQVRRWVEAVDNPAGFLHSKHLKQDNLLNRRIIMDLVWRWSKNELPKAIDHWNGLKARYGFFKDRRYDLSRRLALRGAYRRLPEAPVWLSQVDVRSDDLEFQEWRVRASLLAQDWPTVIKLIEQLPAEEQQEDHWAYWTARAKEAGGDQVAADAIYRDLAQLQTYHGFLSADRVGLPYSLYDEPVDPDEVLLAKMRGNAALIRAREYHHTGITWEARREWNKALAGFSPEQVRASIVLAHDWALPDRAIISAGRAEANRALRYRFPLLFEEPVAKAAADMEIDPPIIYGVMRRESAFISDIKSGAGAVGLMQLMPRTAKYVADLKGKKKWRGDLTDVKLNIDFGAFYLRHVLNRFDNHLPLALASYNAGPHRVKKWLPKENDLPADVWIDTIPFTETRRYVRAVLAYSMIFEWRMRGEVTRLDTRLPLVARAEAKQG